MNLVFDVGNTSITAGLFDGLNCLHEFRLRSSSDMAADQYEKIIREQINAFIKSEQSLQRETEPQIRQIAISSVVPKLTFTMKQVSQKLSLFDVYIVSPLENFPVEVRIRERHTIGADRVVNAFAVREKYGTPAVVVDYGTATTFDVVSSDGAYIGGVIAPGIQISHDALVSRTAQLPEINIEWPESVIGISTETAMQSGLLRGHVAMTNGILDQIEKEVGALSHVVVTGGYGALIKDHTKRKLAYDPQLTLWGLAKLLQTNF